MVGGDEPAFAAVEPLLRVMGANVVLQGGPGAGQHTKMANQVAIAGSMLATVESLAYAEHAGLDPRRVLLSIGAGSAASWSLANLAPRILDGNFAPGFYVKHFVKDMRIALESAAEMGIELPGLSTAKRLYDLLEADGGADLGTQALWLLYADDAARAREGVDAGRRASRSGVGGVSLALAIACAVGGARARRAGRVSARRECSRFAAGVLGAERRRRGRCAALDFAGLVLGAGWLAYGALGLMGGLITG